MLTKRDIDIQFAAVAAVTRVLAAAREHLTASGEGVEYYAELEPNYWYQLIGGRGLIYFLTAGLSIRSVRNASYASESAVQEVAESIKADLNTVLEYCQDLPAELFGSQRTEDKKGGMLKHISIMISSVTTSGRDLYMNVDAYTSTEVFDMYTLGSTKWAVDLLDNLSGIRDVPSFPKDARPREQSDNPAALCLHSIKRFDITQQQMIWIAKQLKSESPAVRFEGRALVLTSISNKAQIREYAKSFATKLAYELSDRVETLMLVSDFDNAVSSGSTLVDFYEYEADEDNEITPPGRTEGSVLYRLHARDGFDWVSFNAFRNITSIKSGERKELNPLEEVVKNLRDLADTYASYSAEFQNALDRAANLPDAITELYTADKQEISLTHKAFIDYVLEDEGRCCTLSMFSPKPGSRLRYRLEVLGPLSTLATNFMNYKAMCQDFGKEVKKYLR